MAVVANGAAGDMIERAYREGKEAGSELLDRHGALAALEAEFLQEVEARVEEEQTETEALRSQVQVLTDQRSREEENLKAARDRRALLDARRTELDERHWARRKGVSLSLGLVFIGLTILLLLADYSLMARVLAVAAGLPFENALDGQPVTATELVFRDPVAMMRLFPEIVLLTTTALVIGFYYKAFRENWDDERRRAWDRRLHRLAAGLSVVTIVALAILRYLTPLTGGDTTAESAPVQVVSGIIGLSLPIVATGFFLAGFPALRCFLRQAHGILMWLPRKGFGALRSGTELWRLRRVAKMRKDAYDLERKIEQLSKRSGIASKVRVDTVEAMRLRFEAGYHDGVRALAGETGRGVYDRMVPIIVGRVLSGEPDAQA